MIEIISYLKLFTVTPSTTEHTLENIYISETNYSEPKGMNRMLPHLHQVYTRYLMTFSIKNEIVYRIIS